MRELKVTVTVVNPEQDLGGKKPEGELGEMGVTILSNLASETHEIKLQVPDDADPARVENLIMISFDKATSVAFEWTTPVSA